MVLEADGDGNRDGFRPLAGLRVLELGRMLSGPMAGLVLADLGADVVKVEHPRHGDETRAVPPDQGGISHYFIAANRGKRSITIDLGHPDAGRALGPLVGRADIVVENWRPGKLAALGFGFDWMQGHNPTLILCSISGFGQTGSDARRPAFDLLTQALSGAMSINGDPGRGPTKVGLPLADLAAGLWAAIGVLSALAAEPRRAVHLDISMRESVTGLLSYLGQLVLATGEELPPLGSTHPHVVPYGRFRAADGWIVLLLPTGVFWRRFCTAAGRQELIEDPRFRTTADRRAHRQELQGLVADLIATRTVAEWEAAFADGDVPGGAVLGIYQALASQQTSGRDPFVEVDVGDETVRSIRNPIRAVGTDRPPASSVARLGRHTDEVLEECGLAATAIAALHRAGVLGGRGGTTSRTTETDLAAWSGAGAEAPVERA